MPETWGHCYHHRAPVPIHRETYDVPVEKDWKLIGWEYSAVESEIHPFDRTVVKAIRRELLPTFVPLIVRSVWESAAGSIHVYEHHALSHMVKVAGGKHQKRRILWPASPGAINWGFHAKGADLVLEMILEGPKRHPSMPGEFRPLSWGVFHQLKASMQTRESERHDLAAGQEYVEQKQAAQDASNAAARSEIAYRIDHDVAKDIKKVHDDIGKDEYARMGAPRPTDATVHMKGAA